APSGPDGLPLIGNTIQYARDPCGFREKCAEKYGDVVYMDLLGMDTYMVTDPEEIKRVLITERDKFKKPDSSQRELGHIVGDGLLMSEGELWKRQRQLMQPVFFGDKVEEYESVMVQNTQRWMDRWEVGETYNIEHEMKDLTLRTLIESMFGTDIEYENREIRSAVKELLKPAQPERLPLTFVFPKWVPLPMYRNSWNALEQIEDLIHEMIRRRREGENEDRDDLLSILLRARDEDGNQMSDKQLRDEMVTILLAGHETSASPVLFDPRGSPPRVSRTL
ncbi:MAG: cytochrome P450, partial [Halobacteria archaeon]|nr:cytochrome P450 [Halobacteria archaeon]